ncbi:hypothetical protein I3J14_34795 [Streptomyces sp. HB-N217]|uniref:hypothetical protein n=1 Tax=Streptomyces sp. HB-N217 TaxID=2792016 RepID=UPI0018D5FB2B|nr:hypothetical protein [Streptomyces sp. HB-N217]MBH5135218.1 hypothetical protein [Streptomyces sp. HB-N217]
MSVRVRLVSFEAWNITRFMFVTGKQREIAGASELITHLDRRWVRESLREVFGQGYGPGWRIEERPAELLESGAGTAKVLVRGKDEARRLVTAVTGRALRQAPGLDVCGVVGGEFEWERPGGLHRALDECAEELAGVRTALPGPDARFLRLPVVDSCRATGLPAAQVLGLPDGPVEARSAESVAKWRAYGRRGEGEGLARMAELAGTRPRALAEVVEHLNDRAEWVGTVYADGNGLGRVFGSFERCVEGESNRAYAEEFRAFSAGLQECTREAFGCAVAELEGLGAALKGGIVPVLPLVLGGDDMVALCAGEWALPFAEAYLRAFERLTAVRETVAGPLGRLEQAETGAAGPSVGAGLSACAGVAVVKPHFPFVDAQRLAYALLREAKQVKEKVPGPCSGLSFHVLYDSTQAGLGRLRDPCTLAGTPAGAGAGEGTTRLVAQPYVVGDRGAGVAWVRGRRWADLLDRVAALTARVADGERLLPSSQVHALREALFAGPRVADAQFAVLRGRYGGRGLERVGGDAESLFWREEPGGRWVCGLLDAMDVVGFVPPARDEAAAVGGGADAAPAEERA